MTEPGEQVLAAAPARTGFAYAVDRLKLLAAAAAVPVALLPFARLHWVADLATPFVPQYLFAAAVFTAVFAAAGDRRWRNGAGLVFVAVALLWGRPAFAPTGVAETDGPRVRLLSTNVLTSNRDGGAFLDLVRRSQPDVIVALEVDRRWAATLEGLAAEYPFRRVVPRDDNFGIALLSRYELADLTTVMHDGVPVIRATVETATPFTLFARHPLPPVGAENWRSRNRHLEDLAVETAAADCPVVVAGDLNLPPWSPFFRDLLREGRLCDSRRSLSVFDADGTWPAPLWPFWPLRTPIDHVLHTRDVATVSRRLGADIGSDHLPVLVELALPGPVEAGQAE
ncbi:MAG: endonuclease/exonuclease/phosphatase family protein [Planctomycetota bacterium]